MGSRWGTEPTEEESCFASLLGLLEHCGRFDAAGFSSSSSSCEACDEVEERLLPQEE